MTPNDLCVTLLTKYGDLILTSDLIGVIDFFLVLSMHTRCNKPEQNRTLFKIFAI